MANEIYAQIILKIDKGDFHLDEDRNFISTMSGLNSIQHVQNVGQTEEAILLGDVTPGGVMLVVNLDTTSGNYVEIRPNTGVADLIQVGTGEFAFFRLTDDAVPYAISNNATSEVLFILIED